MVHYKFQAKKLTQLIGKSGFTQEEFIKELASVGLDVTRQTLFYSWCVGETTPDVDSLAKLACFFNVPVSDFFKTSKMRCGSAHKIASDGASLAQDAKSLSK